MEMPLEVIADVYLYEGWWIRVSCIKLNEQGKWKKILPDHQNRIAPRFKCELLFLFPFPFFFSLSSFCWLQKICPSRVSRGFHQAEHLYLTHSAQMLCIFIGLRIRKSALPRPINLLCVSKSEIIQLEFMLKLFLKCDLNVSVCPDFHTVEYLILQQAKKDSYWLINVSYSIL